MGVPVSQDLFDSIGYKAAQYPVDICSVILTGCCAYFPVTCQLQLISKRHLLVRYTRPLSDWFVYAVCCKVYIPELVLIGLIAGTAHSEILLG